MYLWHILSREENKLINRVYRIQSVCNNNGDWVKLVEADKSEIGISVTNYEVQGVSKDMFKNYVKKKITENHLKYLNSLKRKHSK